MAWININWGSFGMTRGGLVDGFGRIALPPKKHDPDDEVLHITMTGAALDPLTHLFGWPPRSDVWSDWILWYYIPEPVRVRDLLPTVSVPRGGIRFIQDDDA